MAESIIKYSINNLNTESLIGLNVGDKVYFKASGTIKKKDNEFIIENVTTTITRVVNDNDNDNDNYINYKLINNNDNEGEIVLKNIN